jgi:HhH-GPD superfamily base excision DNA repair protein
VRSIIGQQLSTKAARAIHERLLESFGGHEPTPAQILAADPDQMRAAAGLSRAKVTFLHSLAEHVESGALDLERLGEREDDEVIAQLAGGAATRSRSRHSPLHACQPKAGNPFGGSVPADIAKLSPHLAGTQIGARRRLPVQARERRGARLTDSRAPLQPHHRAEPHLAHPPSTRR